MSIFVCSQASINECTFDEQVVVKKYKDNNTNQFLLESVILKKLKEKKNIVKLVGVSKRRRAIFLRKYDCDLFTYCFEQHRVFTERQFKGMFLEICTGLQSAHQEGIAHLDLKPENVLVDTSSMTFFLCDFGLSYISPTGRNGPCSGIGSVGTQEYRAPEINQSPEWYDPFAADIFSLGCLMFTLLTKMFPDFDKRGKLIFPPEICIASSFKSILRIMLSPKPEERPTIEDVLQSSIFKEPSVSVLQRIAKRAKMRCAKKNGSL